MDPAFPTQAIPPDRFAPVFAHYQETDIPQYQGNPLIEALPPIFTQKDVATRLRQVPAWKEADRQQPQHLRYHLLQTTQNLFVPLPTHLDLEQRLSRVIRAGYQARNPLQQGYWRTMRENLQEVSRDGITNPPSSGASHGFTIIGISGIGKTTAINRLLALYPQVIDHREYAQHPFTSRQLVWAKLECPFDGSVKGLCINFLQYVDDHLGTSYVTNYGVRRRTVDELLPTLARVASLHHLGVLVIDEIQHLSEAKSGGAQRMLNFFVQLINTIGLPVVLVGTYKALPILSGEFRQMRRACGQGDFLWNPMVEDATWQLFLESLWKYQYVQHRSPLTEALTHLLHEETQGITDLAVKLLMVAQHRAISTGIERLTANIIRSVARDSFRLVAPVLAALRNQDFLALSHMEDVFLPAEFAPFPARPERTPSIDRDTSQHSPLTSPSPAQAATPSKASSAPTHLLVTSSDPGSPHAPSPPETQGHIPGDSPMKIPRQHPGVQTPQTSQERQRSRSPRQALSQDKLPTLYEVIAGESKGPARAYDILRSKGIVRSLEDDLSSPPHAHDRHVP